jgi:hypothetical protein
MPKTNPLTTDSEILSAEELINAIANATQSDAPSVVGRLEQSIRTGEDWRPFLPRKRGSASLSLG